MIHITDLSFILGLIIGIGIGAVITDAINKL